MPMSKAKNKYIDSWISYPADDMVYLIFQAEKFTLIFPNFLITKSFNQSRHV